MGVLHEDSAKSALLYFVRRAATVEIDLIIAVPLHNLRSLTHGYWIVTTELANDRVLVRRK